MEAYAGKEKEMVQRQQRGNRALRRIAIAGAVLIAGAALVAGSAGSAGAQTSPAPAGEAAVLVVTSDPPGAVVTLKGPYEWIGMTPWSLHRSISGLYQVEARLPGYETWKSEVVLGEGGVRTLDLRLSRRSGTRAFLRSAIIPGWGQIYRGSKGKGVLLLAGSCAAAAAYGVLDVRYQDKVDDFDGRRAAYERATTLTEIESTRRALDAATEDADDAYDQRRIAIGALAGIYAFNLLDLLFLGGGGEARVGGVTDAGGVSHPPFAMNTALAEDGTLQASLRWSW